MIDFHNEIISFSIIIIVVFGLGLFSAYIQKKNKNNDRD